MQINIQKQSSTANEVNVEGIENAAVKALLYEGLGNNPTISIVLVDASAMQELNKQYRGINNSTDVLSFPMEYDDPDDQTHYFGDVIISMQTAVSQAGRAGHSLASELTLLVVHGVLHLLGYDHADEAETDRMWSAQKEILDTLGLTNIELEPYDE